MSEIADRATAAAVYFEAKKIAYRQTKDGVVLSLLIHPNEVPDPVALAYLGTRYMAALVQLGDDEEPVAPKVPAPAETESVGERPATVAGPGRDAARERGRERYAMADDGERAVIRAALLCKDKVFQRWLRVPSEGMAIEEMRKRLTVMSRSEIASNERAYNAFRDIEFEFHGHAEIRG